VTVHFIDIGGIDDHNCLSYVLVFRMLFKFF